MELSRRTFGLGLLAATLLGSPVGALAQGATPGTAPDAGSSAFDGLGLTELRVTITDAGYEGVPAETAAGRYLVTVTSTGEMGGGVSFMQLPEGITVADLMAMAGPQPGAATPGAEMDMASPAASPGAAPEGEGPGAPPEWYYTTYMAGGLYGEPGTTGRVVLDLVPGTYAVWGDDPTAAQAPVEMVVTEGGTGAVTEPVADVTVTEVGDTGGFAFEYSAELVPGPQVIRIDNTSTQPHFFLLVRSEQPITMDELFALLESPEEPEGIIPVVTTATQSANTTQWIEVDLEAGYHIVLCFVSDPGAGGIPHAFEGMADILVVGDVEGTPASSPAA
ncbi:MAG: hypothetical protein M3462_05800 [Chloroflexota bacterium]|nr:hypothetical protein [Chloroflexota bacterium]